MVLVIAQQSLLNLKKDEIVGAIFKIWIARFGVPNEILSDNGGKFSNNPQEMSGLLNVFVRKTPAESPWSNMMIECEKYPT